MGEAALSEAVSYARSFAESLFVEDLAGPALASEAEAFDDGLNPTQCPQRHRMVRTTENNLECDVCYRDVKGASLICNSCDWVRCGACVAEFIDLDFPDAAPSPAKKRRDTVDRYIAAAFARW